MADPLENSADSSVSAEGASAIPPAPAKKAPAKKAPAKKAPVKKAPAKKAPVKKAPAKKAPAKKAPAKKAAAAKAPAEKAVSSGSGADARARVRGDDTRLTSPMRPVGDYRLPVSLGLAAAGLVALLIGRLRRD